MRADWIRTPDRHGRRVLVVWGLVTAITAAMALNYVVPSFLGDFSTVSMAFYYLGGPLALVLVAEYVARRSSRPWVVAAGTPFLLWASMSVVFGCPGMACQAPEGYQYWRNVEFALDAGIGGPRLLVSAEPGVCRFNCPYKLQILPLLVGYGALAVGALNPSDEAAPRAS